MRMSENDLNRLEENSKQYSKRAVIHRMSKVLNGESNRTKKKPTRKHTNHWEVIGQC